MGWARALWLLSHARGENRVALPKQLVSDKAGLGAGLAACARGTQWQRALHLLAPPLVDCAACSAVITACAEALQWTTAIDLLARSMPSWHLRPDAIAFSAALTACQRSWRWQQALYLLADAKQCALSPGAVSMALAI